ncbi:MAG TPA: phosphoribosylformylglycinamidine synthase subunit PurL, partial [Microscillaceae bacterium]|nr:phosphoribosylformylglycinamidine synthase subunit PurL [Microscillaceae bacterium]
VAITNNLNFGNPYNQEVYWQFVQSVKGIIDACEKLETPVTGGNVSFYNQASTVSKEGGNVSNAVFPTPTIGMLGLMENLENRTTLDFKNVGDLIYLIGEPKNDIAGSEYVYSYHNFKESSAPYFDLEAEYDLQQTIKQLIHEKHILSAHDVADGGLFVTLAECAMPNKLGFSILTTFNELEIRKDAFLFGEAQSRVIVTIKSEDQDIFEDFMKEQSVPYFEIGVVTMSDFKVDTQVLMTTAEATDLYDNTLGRHMDA